MAAGSPSHLLLPNDVNVAPVPGATTTGAKGELQVGTEVPKQGAALKSLNRLKTMR